MSRVNQSTKMEKSCEQFVLNLRSTNSSSYKSFITLMNKYSRKQVKTQDALTQLTGIIQEKSDLISLFNELVHPEMKIPEKENSKNQLNKIFSAVGE